MFELLIIVSQITLIFSLWKQEQIEQETNAMTPYDLYNVVLLIKFFFNHRLLSTRAITALLSTTMF